MSFPTMLYQFFLMPIQLVFEVIFSYAYMLTGEQAGIAIISLSLTMNLLVLPLYRRADALQEEERLTEARLHDGIAHIKKSFRGDERTMILQTYYRQNNYSPLYVLRSAVSLFLEIPFFIVAYNFLSGLTLLQGVTFGPIADLGKPDGLIVLGGLHINVLPVLMTAVNVVSTAIFTKGYPLKTKIQLYGMAAFFLVFLYDSPSGLVFYWTLNNVFSLVKTIFYKIKNPQKALKILLLAIGAFLFGFGVVRTSQGELIDNTAGLMVIGVLLCLPLIWSVVKSKLKIKTPEVTAKPDKKLFLCSAGFLTVLTGFLIPSAVITASPQEFLIIGNDLHPIWYVVSALLAAGGFYLLWMGVFYWLFSPKAKVVMERIMLVLCGVSIVNYLFFGNNLGTLTAELEYDNGIFFTVTEAVVNIIVITATAALLLFLAVKAKKLTKGIVLAASAAMLCMCGINSVGIFNSVAEIDMAALAASDKQPQLTLSKNGKNVVVFMLDRAMGEYMPFILSEHPELEETFSGFTYYNNVVSFGGYTNFGTPAVFGGYEYTPIEFNKRDKEPLEKKHNESLKVLPALFDKEGYDVTVCDPPYAGYKEIPDLSIYDDYPDIKTYITQGTVFSSKERKEQTIPNRYRNFFFFSFIKTTPAAIQWSLYDGGAYHQCNHYHFSFEKSYDVLKSLPEITKLDEKQTGSFIMMDNDTTHNPVIFSDEDYLVVDNNTSTDKYPDSVTCNGMTLDISGHYQLSHYQTNIAAYKRIGEWLDYLKKEGVYDNTRIIIVSDHGRDTAQLSNFIFGSGKLDDVEFFFPLLMVKDFNSKGFKTSDEFMTTADVPTLATEGVIESPVNPISGKPLTNDEKTAHKQMIIASEIWDISENNGTQYLPARWYSVHDSIWDRKNWTKEAENKVLTENK